MTSRIAPQRWLGSVLTWLWSWLRRPWLAIFAGIIGLTLLAAVWLLPQLPGQLIDEHAAAANWLLNTSTAYGIWGSPFLALGLFDVLRSPLLYLLLALLLPALAAQLADQLGALRQHRSVTALNLGQSLNSADAAIPVVATRTLYRQRHVLNADPTVISEALASHLRTTYPKLDHTTVTSHATNTVSAPETRIRAQRNLTLQYLRPLLLVGLLLSVFGAWSALAFGWQVTAPPLAPGATFRSANRNLMLTYRVPMTATETPYLLADYQDVELQTPVDEATRRPLGTATLQVRPAHPAILIATADQSARLSRPGESTLISQLGLVFASPGSEESVLIPDQSAGLRVVQRAGTDAFVLELYRSDAIQPIYRADLTPGGQLTVPLGPSDPGLIVTAMPGLRIDIRYLPGLLLVPLGLLLALVGALAFVRASDFVIAQVAPWTSQHSIVILQADNPSTISDITNLLRNNISLPNVLPPDMPNDNPTSTTSAYPPEVAT